jgi:hypothetical protein
VVSAAADVVGAAGVSGATTLLSSPGEATELVGDANARTTATARAAVRSRSTGVDWLRGC